jgi:hypothetical protein
MAKDSLITAFLNEEDAAKLSPAARQLTAGDLLGAMKNFNHGKPSHRTPAMDAMTPADWKTVAKVLPRMAMKKK